VTIPPSNASAHVEGVQHVPLTQYPLFVPQPEPQLMLWPQAFSALPHTALPQEGAGHVVHVPETQWVPVAHPAHWTLPLPQALATVPHVDLVHSGGAALHTPSMHCRPVAHEQFSVFPQASATLPQRWVVLSGVQVGAGQEVAASTETCGTQVLPMHIWLAAQPPQLMGTPHPSTPTLPQRLVHDLAWHDWEAPELTQT
jgi:hypothetical protein